MDIETLTNHVAGLGKVYFENACRIVLNDVFDLHAINIDGKNDGGSDFAAFNNEGERINVAYQITTQKSAIKTKAYKDAAKAIQKLNVSRFYFLTSFIVEEVEARKIENEITKELKIQTVCLSSKHIAGLILSENLLNKFLDETNYPLPRDYTPTYDYREMALHSYTLLSDDASQMKSSIYDDTVLFLLSNSEPLEENILAQKVKDFLSLNDTKIEVLKRRIGALFGKSKIKRTENGFIELHPDAKEELASRKKVYEIELSSLSSAQVDILRTEYNCD